jgi:hypothetical protein
MLSWARGAPRRPTAATLPLVALAARPAHQRDAHLVGHLDDRAEEIFDSSRSMFTEVLA